MRMGGSGDSARVWAGVASHKVRMRFACSVAYEGLSKHPASAGDTPKAGRGAGTHAFGRLRPIWSRITATRRHRLRKSVEISFWKRRES